MAFNRRGEYGWLAVVGRSFQNGSNTNASCHVHSPKLFSCIIRNGKRRKDSVLSPNATQTDPVHSGK